MIKVWTTRRRGLWQRERGSIVFMWVSYCYSRDDMQRIFAVERKVSVCLSVRHDPNTAWLIVENLSPSDSPNIPVFWGCLLISLSVTCDQQRSTVGPVIYIVVRSSKAQYTPPTPTQLHCRVESRRRCVLNSQLVGDSLDESRRVWTIELPTTKSISSCRRCERTSRQSWPSFQFSAPVTYRLQNCKLGHDNRQARTHRWHNSTRQDKFSTCSVSKFSSAVVVS